MIGRFIDMVLPEAENERRLGSKTSELLSENLYPKKFVGYAGILGPQYEPDARYPILAILYDPRDIQRARRIQSVREASLGLAMYIIAMAAGYVYLKSSQQEELVPQAPQVLE